MLEGTLIAESLRVGTALVDLNLIVRKSAGTGPVATRPGGPQRKPTGGNSPSRNPSSTWTV